MPTYDYECEKGHHFELFQSMKDDALKKCQECGAAVKRLIGPGAGFLFKGDGFYITENRSKEYQKQASADSSSSSEKSSKSTSDKSQAKAKDKGASSSSGSKNKKD